jgi:hypothetical protein
MSSPSTLRIAGWGAVSPAGWTATDLAEAVLDGRDLPPTLDVRHPEAPAIPCRRVPELTAPPPWLRHPRLRRTSPITRFAVSAALEALQRQRPLDVRRGLTQTGPHRDDLVLTLDGHDLRIVGSAGQQRTAAIVLRLLEAGTHHGATGVMPVLLLDDPFAELDRGRTERILTLLDALGDGQHVVCVPRADEIPARFIRLTRWTVRAGAFAPMA